MCPGCLQTDLEAGRDEAVAGPGNVQGQPQRGSRQAGRERQGRGTDGKRDRWVQTRLQSLCSTSAGERRADEEQKQPLASPPPTHLDPGPPWPTAHARARVSAHLWFLSIAITVLLRLALSLQSTTKLEQLFLLFTTPPVRASQTWTQLPNLHFEACNAAEHCKLSLIESLTDTRCMSTTL